MENKLKLLLEGIAEGLYGHISHPGAYWNQLSQYFDEYLAFCSQSSEVNRLLDETQRVILDHPLGKFPVALPHSYRIVKWLQDCLERWNENLPNRLSALITPLDEINEPKFIYRSLKRNLFSEEATVTLLEENEIIGNGTTGLTSWQGALYLTDWLLANAVDKFQNKKILELGCGVGFVGLHLLKSVPVQSFAFTDCHPKVLNNVWFNLKLNFENDFTPETLSLCTKQGPQVRPMANFPWTLREHSHLSVHQLDWTAFSSAADVFGSRDFDFILGADVVYERSLIEPLCGVLGAFLQGGRAKAYIACTERSQTTLSCFEEALRAIKAQFQVIARGSYTPSENFLCSDVTHQPTRIYEISCL